MFLILIAAGFLLLMSKVGNYDRSRFYLYLQWLKFMEGHLEYGLFLHAPSAFFAHLTLRTSRST